MSLKLVSLFPDHLNLNGDLANLMVLQKRAIWMGVEADIVDVKPGQQIPHDAAIVILGHGSAAAWADIEPQLPSIFEQINRVVASGAQLIAIASGYERAIAQGFFAGPVNASKRVSKFEVTEVIRAGGAVPVLGYLNAATDARVIQENEKGIGTQLHGPFLAKNPSIADEILALACSRRGLQLRYENRSAIEKIESLVQEVWSLEEELARE